MYEKKIIVVYPEHYEDLAMVLTHEISKVDGFDSAAWTLEFYRQNMPTLSGRSYVIFIGDAEENPFSKMYLSQISNLVNIKGACFGRNGSKAVVFGDGNLEQKEDFEAFTSMLGAANMASGSVGAAVGVAFLGAAPLVALALGGTLVGRVVKYFKNKSAEKELRYEQTKLAIHEFSLTELDVWVGNEA